MESGPYLPLSNWRTRLSLQLIPWLFLMAQEIIDVWVIATVIVAFNVPSTQLMVEFATDLPGLAEWGGLV